MDHSLYATGPGEESQLNIHQAIQVFGQNSSGKLELREDNGTQVIYVVPNDFTDFNQPVELNILKSEWAITAPNYLVKKLENDHTTVKVALDSNVNPDKKITFDVVCYSQRVMQSLSGKHDTIAIGTASMKIDDNLGLIFSTEIDDNESF